jgi:hypothetical protein
VEVLGERCFAECGALDSLTFEAGSRLARVEDNAFQGCDALEPPFIPHSAQVSANCFSTVNDDISFLLQSL